MIELVILAGFVGVAGATLGAVVQAYRRTRPGGPLPIAGPPPEDRGEAVRRLLKHLQRKTIAELEEGTAAVVVGTVVAIPGVAPLRSPARDVECLGYHLDIRYSEPDVAFRYAQLHEDAKCVAIEVHDETGAVRVEPTGLELAITDHPAELRVPPHPPGLLARLPRNYYFAPVTVEEGLLVEGMRILVCGLVARELDASQYRDGAPTLVFRASATFPLVASTDADLFTATSRPIAPEELRDRH